MAHLRIERGIVEEASCPTCGISILPPVYLDRYAIEDVIYEHLKEAHVDLKFVEPRGASPFDFSSDEGIVDVNVFVA